MMIGLCRLIFLSIYVGDFKLSVDEARVTRGWDHIRKSGLEIGPTQKGDDVYLGCSHEKRTVVVEGRSHNVMIYNVESNITKIVEKYESLLTKFTGGKMKLLPFARASTPHSPQESESCLRHALLSECR